VSPLRFARACLTCGILQRVGNRCQPCTNKIVSKRERERYGPTARSPYADPEWRRLSREMRSAYPWCFACKSTTDLTVDHIIPLQPGQSPVVPMDMLTVLCRSCHGKKTGRGRVRI
jgi:5-methylcytosine-specific restriction endonuclease McrA